MSDLAIRERESVSFVLTYRNYGNYRENSTGNRLMSRKLREDLQLLDAMDGSMHLPGTTPRAGHAFHDHAKATHVQADRRRRLCADNVAPRRHRWRAQLGLPILLASGYDVHASGSDEQ